MRVPRRFMFSDGCLSCTLRRDGDFCDLPHPLLSELHEMGHLTLYPPDAVLMTEGQAPRGVYIGTASQFASMSGSPIRASIGMSRR